MTSWAKIVNNQIKQVRHFPLIVIDGQDVSGQYRYATADLFAAFGWQPISNVGPQPDDGFAYTRTTQMIDGQPTYVWEQGDLLPRTMPEGVGSTQELAEVASAFEFAAFRDLLKAGKDPQFAATNAATLAVKAMHDVAAVPGGAEYLADLRANKILDAFDQIDEANE